MYRQGVPARRLPPVRAGRVRGAVPPGHGCEARPRAADHDWPRHNKTDDQAERTLGVWLHIQRIDHRSGKLDPPKEKQLNQVVPGLASRTPAAGRKQPTMGGSPNL